MTRAPDLDPKERFLTNFRYRFYRGLDYLTLFLFVAFVAITALLVDFAMIIVIERTVASSIAKYPIVAAFFDWFQIGTALLVFLAAFVHALFSALFQIRFEYETNSAPES